jgi:hypothetical protein
MRSAVINWTNAKPAATAANHAFISSWLENPKFEIGSKVASWMRP